MDGLLIPALMLAGYGLMRLMRWIGAGYEHQHSYTDVLYGRYDDEDDQDGGTRGGPPRPRETGGGYGEAPPRVRP